MAESTRAAPVRGVPSEPSEPCLCGATDYRLIYRATYVRSQPTPYEFTLYECRTCGLARVAPVPSIALYDAGFVGSTADGRYIEREKPWDRITANCVEEIVAGHPRLKGTPILDVGCNGGELVAELVDRGFTADGCDVDPVAIDHGRGKGRSLFLRDLSEQELDRQYGVVVLNHTLEHVIPAGPMIRHIHDALLPGGLLYIRVPNHRGWIARIMKANWGFLVPQQHVWQFSPRTLRQFVATNGPFEPVSIRCRTALEYRSTGIKGLVKNTIMRAAQWCNAGDELVALFRKA